MIQAPRGTKDVLPQDSYKWHYIERIAREIAESFGYKEIRTPTFEFTELFTHGVGDTTDIVQKEMYTFEDKGGRSITLKPEGTAGVARAYIEHHLNAQIQPVKMYYITPVFRYEKPQLGREREHHQFGCEIFGATDAAVDAELIYLAMTVYKKAGLKDLEVHINNIGCPQIADDSVGCRSNYNNILKAYLKKNLNSLCETCNSRFEKNPLRILDCKEKGCKKVIENVPLMIDYLCQDCNEHFQKLKSNLNNLGVKYEIDPYIVRGLDYYTKTVFEIVCKDFGTSLTLCGGGRYDKLIEQLGGEPTPGVGFGIGIERLLLTLEELNIKIPYLKSLDLFIATVDESSKEKAQNLLYKFRGNNISCDMDYISRSLKAQMKYADKINVKFTMVLGEDEIKSGKASVKNMLTGEKFDIGLDDSITQMKNILEG